MKNLELIPINNKFQVPEIIHGTYYKNWNLIKNEGLSCMKRLHIHFAKGLPDDDNVISGMRQSAQVYIYINIEKALNDNITFYLSKNNVILSPGNEYGIIETKYFSKVVEANNGKSYYCSNMRDICIINRFIFQEKIFNFNNDVDDHVFLLHFSVIYKKNYLQILNI